MRARNGGMDKSWRLQPPISNLVVRVAPPTTPHARCARNLEASQTQCDDPEPTVPRNLEAALDEEATIAYSLAKDLFADDQPEAPACTCRFAALLDIAVTTAIGIPRSWQSTIPLPISLFYPLLISVYAG